MTKFFHRSSFFWSKSFENTHDGWMMNYIFSFKIHFWCIRIRKGSQVDFGTYFGGNRLDFLHTSTNSNLYLLEESSLSLGRLFCTTQWLYKIWRPWNLGLTSFSGSFCIFCKLNFDFLSLAYLIHAFRISKLHCKAIKLKIEDELRVRLWRLFSDFVLKLLIFILSNTSFFCHNWFRFHLLIYSVLAPGYYIHDVMLVYAQ